MLIGRPTTPITGTVVSPRPRRALYPAGGCLPGGDPDYDEQAAVFDVLLQPDRRLVDGRRALVLPARSAVYVTDPRAEPAIELLSEFAAEVGPPLPLRTGSDAAYRLFHWQPATVAASYPWEGDPVRWASGVALLGYDWSRGASRVAGCAGHFTSSSRVSRRQAAISTASTICWTVLATVGGRRMGWGFRLPSGASATRSSSGSTSISVPRHRRRPIPSAAGNCSAITKL